MEDSHSTLPCCPARGQPCLDLTPLTRCFSDFCLCLFKLCDAISKWEQALKELHSRKSEGGTRVVRLMYKSRS